MKHLFQVSILFLILILWIWVFFVWWEKWYTVQINDSECVELDDVVNELLEDPLVQQYQNDWCSVVELLVKRKVEWTTEFKCVIWIKNWNCPLPSFVMDTVIKDTTNLLENFIEEATTSRFINEEIKEPYQPPLITYTPPSSTLRSDSVFWNTARSTSSFASTTTTTNQSRFWSNTSDSWTALNSQNNEILAQIYWVSEVDWVATYTPSPLSSTNPVYDPDFSQDWDFDAFISVAFGTDSLLKTNSDTQLSDIDDVRNSLSQYNNSNTATSQQKESLVDRLMWAIWFDTEAEINQESQEPTVLVDLPEDIEIVESQLFIYANSDEQDTLIEEVKKDLVEKFWSSIKSMEFIFWETQLTKDIVVNIDTNKLTYQEIIDYLDTIDLYVSETDNNISAHPWIEFQVASLSFPWIDDVSSWLWWGSNNENTFNTQSADQEIFEQWHLEYVWYNEIASCATDWRPVKVAIVDNWFDINHKDIDDKIVAMYDEADKDNDVQVPNYKPEWNHGAKETWLIWAEDNEFWVKWIFPNSELILVKSTKDRANGKDITNWIEAIAKAYELGADVINLSRWGYWNVPILEKVTKAVADKGVYLVAAAWNYNKSTKFYPAAYDWVIAVAAIDELGAKASFSNYWPWVDIAAPWVNMMTTDLDNTYAEFNWTSEASPLVAWALWLALSFGLDWSDIEENVFPTRNENLWVWILDLRFLCDIVPEDFSNDTNIQEHNSWWGFLSNIDTGTLIMILWWAMVLLGILWWLISYLVWRNKQ